MIPAGESRYVPANRDFAYAEKSHVQFGFGRLVDNCFFVESRSVGIVDLHHDRRLAQALEAEHDRTGRIRDLGAIAFCQHQALHVALCIRHALNQMPCGFYTVNPDQVFAKDSQRADALDHDPFVCEPDRTIVGGEIQQF